MRITGISAEQFIDAVNKLSTSTYGDNLRVEMRIAREEVSA